VKAICLVLLLCAPIAAQDLTFYLDNSNGSLPVGQLQPLPAVFGFPDTPFGGLSSQMIRIYNSSNAAVQINYVYVGADPGSSTATPNFAVLGLNPDSTVAPGSWKLFQLNFSPAVTGAISGYLQAQVSGVVRSVALLQGNGTAPQLTLSCSGSTAAQCNESVLQPGSTTPLSFGNILTTDSSKLTFTLTNSSGSTLNPRTLVSLSTQTNNPNSAFSLGVLSDTLASGSSISFDVTFAPGAVYTFQSTLNVGANSYALQGTGMANVLGDISSLVVTYMDTAGVTLTAQGASPIKFGDPASGTTGSGSYRFTLTNPQTTINPVTVSTLVVSGNGFVLTGAPSLPIVIQPGSSVSFTVSFSASAVGSYTGTLNIGTRQFGLAGSIVTSPLPELSFGLDLQPLVSSQQAHVTVKLAGASPVATIGTLAIQFTPAVANISDDPAISFTASSGRNLQVKVAAGALTATYNDQSAITFQTGTTAGTLTFTVTFPNKTPYSQSFTISPAQVSIASSTAVRKAPNLIITLNGFDNTYSSGQLQFTFYDTTGRPINSTPIQVNANSAFHDHFFNGNQVGGAFGMQASFPVSGDVNQIGSFGVALANSAGSTTVSQAFK
jgi:hypothetical protein